jgi:copper resistance protein B
MRLAAFLALAFATPAMAQPADPHAGHQAPAAQSADPHAAHHQAPPADPQAAHEAEPAPADPHAGHGQPPVADPHAGHAIPAPAPADPHAGHHMHAPPAASQPPPPVPTDHAADRIFPPTEMAAARDLLRREHGAVRWSTAMLETAEIRPGHDGDVYAWKGRFSYGGDINRLLLKSEGEGRSGDLEQAEVQALYARAIDPFFNFHAGVRQDFQPRPRRTYATVGIEGVAPYWFDVEAAAFLSDNGDLSARLEGSYDLRLTQRLILEPRAELNLAASADRATGVGSGLSDVELGLRLRYAVTPEFAPYVGVDWERKFGDTADYARAAGDDVEDTRLVLGVRAWF